MADLSKAMPTIRAMTAADLERIAEIDRLVLGESRPEYWKLKIELADKRSPMTSLVAELDGKVIGFVLGDARGWEYSVAENIGWIDTIGVDPEYQRMGIAKMLMTEIINNLKNVGVEKIYTFVNWRNWILLRFFDASGFKKGDMINLELKV
jgi:ribosomal protein S18 acetylase RimI-like enzyme